MAPPATLTPSALDPVAEQACPELRSVVGRIAVTLLVACVTPFVLFYTCLVLTDVWVAIFAALGWTYAAIAWRSLTGRRPSGLLILTALVMTGRTAIALAADSTFLYFLQPVLSDGMVAIAFLASLRTARPMVARLAGDFYPMDDELAVRPRIRLLFRRLTILWGVLCLAKGTITLTLLLSQSLHTFVLVKGISVLSLTVLTVAVTIAASTMVARKEGLLGAHPATVG
jgi:uncharacterized membrane protein